MNKFELLPEEDKQFVLDLCEKHIYSEAVKILAQPRPVGLSLITSPATLCRFYTRHSRDCRDALVLGQYAESLRVRREAQEGAPVAAILAAVENRILASLKNGVALKDLADEFRILGSAYRCFSTSEQWRRSEDVPQHHYHKYLNTTADEADLEEDFIAPHERGTEKDPGFEAPEFVCSNEEQHEIEASSLPLPTRENPNPAARLLLQAKAYCKEKSAHHVASTSPDKAAFTSAGAVASGTGPKSH